MLPLADATDIHADTFDLPPEAMREGFNDVAPEGDTHEEHHSRHRGRRDPERAAGLRRQFDRHPRAGAQAAEDGRHLSLSEQCTALGAQFDKAGATYKTNKNYKEALGMRSEGKSLCTAHKEADGVKKIEFGAHLDRREADGEGLRLFAAPS